MIQHCQKPQPHPIHTWSDGVLSCPGVTKPGDDIERTIAISFDLKHFGDPTQIPEVLAHLQREIKLQGFRYDNWEAEQQ